MLDPIETKKYLERNGAQKATMIAFLKEQYIIKIVGGEHVSYVILTGIERMDWTDPPLIGYRYNAKKRYSFSISSHEHEPELVDEFTGELTGILTSDSIYIPSEGLLPDELKAKTAA